VPWASQGHSTHLPPCRRPFLSFAQPPNTCQTGVPGRQTSICGTSSSRSFGLADALSKSIGESTLRNAPAQSSSYFQPHAGATDLRSYSAFRPVTLGGMEHLLQTFLTQPAMQPTSARQRLVVNLGPCSTLQVSYSVSWVVASFPFLC